MSLIDDALAGWVQVETTKAQNPRQVATLQQAESDRRTSIDSASVQAAKSVAKPGISFAGFDNRILYGAGALILGLVVFKLVK